MDRRLLTFGAILIIILALPLTIWLVRNQQENRGRATAPDKLEAEGGILGGNALLNNDPLASGGQYVLFGNQTNVASDTFNRTLASSWGSAETGGTYALFSSTADYNVANNEGSMRIPTAGATRRATLDGISKQDVEISIKAKTDKLSTGSTGSTFYLIGRKNAASEYYGAKFRFGSNQTITIDGAKNVAAVETSLGGSVNVSGLTHAANTYYVAKAQISGTNPTIIRAKIWQDGGLEPANWQYNSSDSTATSLQTSGAVGASATIGSTATNAPITFTFDDYAVKDLSSTPAVVTPAPTSAPTLLFPSGTIYGSSLSLNNLTNPAKDSTGKDLIDVANSLGIKTLRISTWNGPVDSTTHLSTVTKAQWDIILSKLSSYGMKAIIMPNHTTYLAAGDEFNEFYVPFMTDLAVTKGLANHPAVFAINLGNEVYLSQNNIAKMTEVRNMIKATNPNKLVNVGGWKTPATGCPAAYRGSFCWGNPADAYLANDLNDFYSVHIYGFDKPTNFSGQTCTPYSPPPFPTPVTAYTFPNPTQMVSDYINVLRSDLSSRFPTENKPIVIEEFGADNGVVCNSQGHYLTEAQQASIYDKILTYVDQNKTSKNILGSISWQLYEYCSTSQGWGIVSERDSSGNLNCSGTFYINQAANITKNHATANP